MNTYLCILPNEYYILHLTIMSLFHSFNTTSAKCTITSLYALYSRYALRTITLNHGTTPLFRVKNKYRLFRIGDQIFRNINMKASDHSYLHPSLCLGVCGSLSPGHDWNCRCVCCLGCQIAAGFCTVG